MGVVDVVYIVIYYVGSIFLEQFNECFGGVVVFVYVICSGGFVVVIGGMIVVLYVF